MNPKGRFVLAASEALHSIMFALWFGGVIMIGALVAPIAAHLIHHPPQGIDPLMLKHVLTAGLIGESLRRFNYVCYIAGGLMIVVNILQLTKMRVNGTELLTLLRLTLTGLLFVSSLFLGLMIMPRIDICLTVHNMALFDRLHKLYEQIVILFQTPILLAIPAITAIRDAARRPA